MNISDISDPIIGNGAVFVVRVENIKDAPEKSDYNINKETLTNSFKQRVSQDFPYRAIEKSSEVEDKRMLFY